MDEQPLEVRLYPRSLEPELQAIEVCVAALTGLDEPTQGRILRYLMDRMGV